MRDFDPNGELLERIIVYCRTYSISDSQFGTRVLGDSHLVEDLKKGRNVTLRTAHRIDKFINAKISPPQEEA